MKKLLEKIKAFFAKVKLFWTEKVVPVLQKIAKVLKAIKEVLVSNTFVYTFPLAVFGLLAFLLHSVLMVLVCFIWLVPLIGNAGKTEE